MGRVTALSELLLPLLVPHGPATEDGHLGLGLCLDPLESQAFWTEETTNQIKLEEDREGANMNGGIISKKVIDRGLPFICVLIDRGLHLVGLIAGAYPSLVSLDQ